MLIRTKIIATLGPASDDIETLTRLVEAGVDVFRINFSHGTDEHRQTSLQNIRKVEADVGRPLAVLADLCGPKIRVGPIAGGSVLLAQGQEIVIQRESLEGNARRISTTLGELIDAADIGETILLDDGKLRLEVVAINRPVDITCRVVVGGMLASGKGINLPATDLKLSAITERDRENVLWIVQRDFDYVALSFVQRPEDILALRELLDASSCSAHIVAKIEKPRAMEHIEEIVSVADAVMVARGDLGVEMDLPAVPIAQKRIAQLCREAGKPCIIATQMLESMTTAPSPTRAEVSDVANAVLDQADAVMLSGETAIGKYPVLASAMMNEVVSHIQNYHDTHLPEVRVRNSLAPTLAAMAGAVKEIISCEAISAVAVFSATGATALMLAKNRLTCPIVAMAQDIGVVRRMCLYYGVEAIQADAPEHTRDLLSLAAKLVVDRNISAPGDKIVVLSGRPIGTAGATNTIVVHTVT